MATGKYVSRKMKIEDALSDAGSEVEALRDEMGEWRDNLEEKFSQTEKYNAVSEAADNLENAELTDKADTLTSALHDACTDSPAAKGSDVSKAIPEIVELLNEQIDVTDFVPYKGRSISRANRLSNAVGNARSAANRIQEVIDEYEGDDDRIDAVRDALDEFTGALDEVENVEFPGMYG